MADDLLVTPFYDGHTWHAVDLEARPALPQPGDRVDLAVASGMDALRQALVLRLLTPIGSLASLGHASYGSRLHELIGEPWSTGLGLRARAWVLQALAREPRVERVLALALEGPTNAEPHRITLRLSVQARDIADPLELGVEIET
jgi:phage baseplate assembly protein W